MYGVLMTPLVNPSLIAAVLPQTTAASQSAARKANAQTYAAAARDASGPAPAAIQAKPQEQGRSVIAREAPFGAERPRYQRPGTLLDIRV